MYASESSEFESSEFDRVCAPLLGTNSFPARYVAHEVLRGKCLIGQFSRCFLFFRFPFEFFDFYLVPPTNRVEDGVRKMGATMAKPTARKLDYTLTI